MATLEELDGLRSDSGLRAQVRMALVIAAEDITDRFAADPTSGTTAAERKWARYVLNKPDHELDKALNLLLAANKTTEVQDITNPPDTDVQAAVNGIVPYLVQAAED